MRRIFVIISVFASMLFAGPALPTVKSITELRALLPGAYPAVQLLGYVSPGDGGGGVVIWGGTSVKTAAACSVYVPASNPSRGRWERPASPFRLARQCGVMTMADTISGIVTYTDLVGSGTRMVVVSATGTTSTQTIPAGSSLANPTGTIGLTAVNGVLTTPPRSDGAPALSQAIVPTWTGIHTFTPAPVFSSAAGTGTRVVGVTSTGALTASTTWAGAYTWSGIQTYSAALAFGSAGAAADWSVWRSAGAGLSLRGGAGSSYDFALFNPAGTYLIRNPTGTSALELPGSALTATALAGSGTRMVVADASGVMSTQTIPAGSSLANPTGTIGLTAVNGAATSGMRSDGAPALSQAIVPTWTGIHTFTPAPVFSSVTASQILSVNGSKALTSVATTGTGSVVLAASPSITGILSTVAIGNTGGISMANNVGLAQLDFGGVNRGVANLRSDNWLQIGGGQAKGVEFQGNGGVVLGYVNESGIWVLGPSTPTQAIQAYVQGGVKYNYSVLNRTAVTETAGAIAINVALSDFFSITLDDNSTLSNPTNSAEGRRFTIRVKQDGTGTNTLLFGSDYRFPNGIVPDINTNPNSVNYYSFIYDETATKWDFVGNAFNLLPAGS